MNLQDIFYMQDTRSQDLRNSATFTHEALKCLATEFDVDLQHKQITWTDGDHETWALTVGDFVLFPARVTKKTLRGEQFFDGWKIEQVHASTTGFANDLPFYEDVDTEELFETQSWVQALTKLVQESLLARVACKMDGAGAAYEYGKLNHD